MRNIGMIVVLATLGLTLACSEDGSDDSTTTDFGSVMDPDDAQDVEDIDRFSDDAGTLMKRTENDTLPDAGEPIDFDQGPFITKGLGPDGNNVEYYNFDVMSTRPAPIYVLFRESEDEPVDGQLNIVDAVPGDSGYNDFWLMTKVTVPDDYEANTITSLQEIEESNLAMESLDLIVNCPIVPPGSTADKRLDGKEDTGLVRGWYRDELVYYFTFLETGGPQAAKAGKMPTSPIFVTFNDLSEGPGSGFAVESGTDQTHNVVATVPEDEDYSPLWAVAVYDNQEFDDVSDLSSAMDATIVDPNGPTVNCPIVAEK